MEATAAPRALSLLAPSPPPPTLRVSSCGFDAGGGGRRWRGVVAAGAKKRSGKNREAAAERVDKHSFAPKDGEATGPFPEAVLLRKKMAREDGQVSPEFADADEEKLYEFLNIQLESDLNLKRMRHYEVVYLIHEDRVEEVEDVVSKVQDFVREKKGRIWRLNNWGLRRLAYKIKKATHANYILMNFEIEARYINDFKTLLDKDERIIRHLVMKRDEAITEDCPPPPEFHTLRAQQYMDDDYDDDDEEEEEEEEEEEQQQEDFVDTSELESAGYDDNDVEAGDEPEIIFVDEADHDKHEGSRRWNRKMKVKKYTAEKVLR
ncbi:hypothetical protein ACP70R_033458 [Stipagrostis hirtigluma subsp. patula]